MTTTNALSRQPSKLDLPTQFKFTIIKLPKVEYFCTANVLYQYEAMQQQTNHFRDIPVTW